MIDKVTLNKGDYYCNTCEGTGIHISGLLEGISCVDCNGTGKLNWLENIFGKKSEKVVIHLSVKTWMLPDIKYERGDLVVNKGTIYVCDTNHKSTISNEPGCGSHWSYYWYVYSIKPWEKEAETEVNVRVIPGVLAIN